MEKWQLRQMQSLPLSAKIEKTKLRIKEWYEHWDGQVCVSFSGGKDSTVLLHIAREVYPDIRAVFSDTGLEYPEIKEFVKTICDVEWVRPKKTFLQVIEECGYPVVSKKVARFIKDLQNPTDKNITSRNLYLTGYSGKGEYQPTMKLSQKWYKLIDAPFKVSDRCCHIIKKQPLESFTKTTGLKPIIGSMADEGSSREMQYMRHGCNIYDSKKPIAQPMGFWAEQDVLAYLLNYNVPYCSVYGDIVKNEDGSLVTTGETRTGCVFCMFGINLEKTPNRFQRMKDSHPKLYEYCINKLELGKVLDYIDVKYD